MLKQKFNYKAHIAQAFQKSIKLVLALQKLENLYPIIVHRLFQAKKIQVINLNFVSGFINGP